MKSCHWMHFMSFGMFNCVRISLSYAIV